MSTTFLGHNFGHLSLARGGAAAFALVGIAAGATAILNPSQSATTFGFPSTSSTVLTAQKNAFIPTTGARNIANGLAVLGCLVMRYNRAVGVMLVTGAVTGLVDGWSLVRYTRVVDEGRVEEVSAHEGRVREAEKAAFMHWVTLGLYTAVGGWLFLWGDENS